MKIIRKLIKNNEPKTIVDEEFYLNRYPDVKNAGVDAAMHYARCGKYEGRFPNKSVEEENFDGEAYLNAYPDVKKSGMSPYIHYDLYGRKEHRQFFRIKEKSIVDKEFYYQAYEDVKKSGMDAAEHFERFGKFEGRYPNAEEEKKNFDGDAYLSFHPDVKNAKVDPYVHFNKWGRKEKRKRSFKPVPREEIDAYKAYYNDAIFHKDFDTNEFMEMYPSVVSFCARHNINPFIYFTQRGRELGYLPNFNRVKAVQRSFEVYKHTFSIVIPVYNSEEFLANCLSSAYSQTVPNLEVVIVNDGSTDGCGEIIETFRKKYPTRTKVITHSTNMGLVRTHIDGISAATGDFFAILDGDDWLSPYFCEIMGEVAIACRVSSVICAWSRPMKYVEPNKYKEDIQELRVLKGGHIEKAIANWGGQTNIHYGLNRKLYKRDAWDMEKYLSIENDILYWEDAIVTSRFYKEQQSVALISNKLYSWFLNPQSVGSGILKRKYIDDSLKVINVLKNECDDTLYNRNVRNIFCTEFVNRLSSIHNNNEHKRDIIMYFAELYDENSTLFSQELSDNLFVSIIEQYAKTFTDEDVEDFVLFVDAIGQPLIARHYIDYLEENAPFKFKYVQSSDRDSMIERLKRVKLGCTCRIIVTDGGWSRKEFYTRRPLIQLWHGMGAVKYAAPLPLSYRPQLGFCSSKSVIPVYSKLYGLPANKVLPYGAIEADCYFSAENIENARNRVLEQHPGLCGKKIYFWAPTFRGMSPNCYLQDELDLSRLNSLLSEDEVMIIKFHPAIVYYQKEKYSIEGFSRIIDMSSYSNIQDLMCISDVFMTDYSSSMHYALLLDKPIVYLITDWDEYKKSVGLLLNLETLPGTVCKTRDVDNIVTALRTASSDTSKYKEFKKYHVGSCTGNSRERITSSIFDFYRENGGI